MVRGLGLLCSMEGASVSMVSYTAKNMAQAGNDANNISTNALVQVPEMNFATITNSLQSRLDGGQSDTGQVRPWPPQERRRQRGRKVLQYPLRCRFQSWATVFDGI